MRAIILPVLATATLTACASATPPSSSTADLQAAKVEFNRLNALPQTTVANLPNSAATYNGKMQGTFEVNGVSGHDIVGDVQMNINFTGPAQVTGTVSNINMFSTESPDQLLGGSLAITGNAPNGVFTATASGTLDLVAFDLPLRGDAPVDFAMTGSTKTDAGTTPTATSVVGTWTGGTNVAATYTISNGSGSFYATKD